MFHNFLKSAFGCFTLLFAFGALSLMVVALLKYISFLALPIAIFEWTFPIIFVGLYTVFIYKDRFSPSFKFRVALYNLIWLSIMMTLVFFIAKLYGKSSIIPTYISQNLSSDYLEFFNASDVKNVTFLTYIAFLILSPFMLAYNYLMLTIGNSIGLRFLKKDTEVKS